MGLDRIRKKKKKKKKSVNGIFIKVWLKGKSNCIVFSLVLHKAFLPDNGDKAY